MPPFLTAKRHVRIANCSGASMDHGSHMYNQAIHGPVDVITGDYLAEGTMAMGAIKKTQHSQPGWVGTALAGIKMSLNVIHEKRIKVIVNGGGLNPMGLAETIKQLIAKRGIQLCVGFVDGDDLMPIMQTVLSKQGTIKSSWPFQHLDDKNSRVQLAKNTFSFLENRETMPIIAANAYLGYRAIKKGLDEGADIIICGRVADASPVIAAAAWWYGWAETDFDRLAGSLIAGHLIECSTYVTGGNFSGADRYPAKAFTNLGLPIAEIFENGECVVTKHKSLGGFVTTDTVKSQFLYELQGNIYLNSDVKADVSQIKVKSWGGNRVHVSGIKGHPPPPTTKVAIFYRSGYQLEILVNATGLAIDHKWDIQEMQMRSKLEEWGTLESLDVLDFQRVGVSKDNPDSQLSATSYMRIFAQAKDEETVGSVSEAWMFCFMAHFAGMNCSLDFRTLQPRQFLGYFPGVVPQKQLEEAVTILGSNLGAGQRRFVVGPPRMTEELSPREDYETANSHPLKSFGPSSLRPLGDVVLGRSGDKAGNINLGLFVHTAEQYKWLQSFMTKEKLKELMGQDWRERYFLERVEMPHIYAVHFVIYGPLERGVSSSKLLDNLGKGFAEFIRAVWVQIPTKFLQGEVAKL